MSFLLPDLNSLGSKSDSNSKSRKQSPASIKQSSKHKTIKESDFVTPYMRKLIQIDKDHKHLYTCSKCPLKGQMNAKGLWKHLKSSYHESRTLGQTEKDLLALLISKCPQRSQKNPSNQEESKEKGEKSNNNF